MVSYTSTVAILALALCASSLVQADVSHLGYNRYSRPASTRLQRLESNPTPYPAAGYRPNREFNLPREQPLFPQGQQPTQQNKQNNNGGFDFLSEPQQPQLTYGAPSRFPQGNQQAQENQQNSNNNNGGFDVLSEPQQPQLTYGAPSRYRQAPVRLQQQPQLTYGAPQQDQGQEQLSQPQPQPQSPSQNNNNAASFDNQAEPQRPNVLYGAPSRFRQAPARLQQQQQQQQQLQQFYAAPQAERLTDNREDKEDEDDQNAETSADIETDNKKEDAKKVAAPQNVATIAYYPAGAFGFVQPVSARYVAAAPNAAAYVAAAPSAAYVNAATRAAFVAAPSAAYVAAPNVYQSPFLATAAAASPFVQQPLTFAAPAHLRAW